jgi:tetratricopeptide (TPR) repeat protein
MTALSRIYWAALIGAGLTCIASPPARAAVAVFGSSFAHDCFLSAKYSAALEFGLQACDRAIDDEPLDRHDLAGTYVNRGVIQMERTQYKGAEHDFDQALALIPNLGEALVNQGGAQIAQKRYAEGVAQITRGLAFAPEEPEKAYYNRALGYEALDDLKSAYFDYLKASQIKPDWAAPKAELVRFTVSPKTP